MIASGRILVLSANPIGTGQLRLDEEVREIEEGLRRSKRRDEFTLSQKWAVRPNDLRRAMLDTKPQIAHFCGHGAGQDGIVLEDNIGRSHLVPTEALAELFKLCKEGLNCVVLNGCYTEVQAKAISRHVPYVIGTKKAIGDQAAVAFTTGFYDALGDGKTFDDAFAFGCNAIQLMNVPGPLIPKLFKGRRPRRVASAVNQLAPGSVEVPPHTQQNVDPPPAKTRGRWLVPGLLIAFAATAAATSGYIAIWGWSSDPSLDSRVGPPEPSAKSAPVERTPPDAPAHKEIQSSNAGDEHSTEPSPALEKATSGSLHTSRDTPAKLAPPQAILSPPKKLILTLKQLSCLITEDNTRDRFPFTPGEDEAYIKVNDNKIWGWKSMEAGSQQDINFRVDLGSGTKIELWDYDTPDPDDFLGSWMVKSDERGDHTATFREDGASYTLTYTVTEQ